MLNNNGSAITPKRAQQFRPGLTRIRFSLDAFSAESYPKVRVELYLWKKLKNIETFLNLKEQGNYKLPVTGVSFVKMKHNEHELDDFINYWRDRVDMVSIQTFTPPTTNVEKYEKFYASDQLIESEPYLNSNVFNLSKELLFVMRLYTLAVNFNKDLSIGKLGQDTIHSAWHSKK